MCVVIVSASVIAAALGRPVWAAALGAALVLAYWALELFAWRRAEERESFSGSLLVALGGAALRFVLMLAGLLAIALLARDAFATAVLSFLAAFTVYLPFRLGVPQTATPPTEAGAR